MLVAFGIMGAGILIVAVGIFFLFWAKRKSEVARTLWQESQHKRELAKKELENEIFTTARMSTFKLPVFQSFQSFFCPGVGFGF